MQRSQNGLALRLGLSQLQRDREVVLAAVSSAGKALCYASVKLQIDKAIVIAAVTQDGSALRFASRELQADWEVLAAAVCGGAAERTAYFQQRGGGAGGIGSSTGAGRPPGTSSPTKGDRSPSRGSAEGSTEGSTEGSAEAHQRTMSIKYGGQRLRVAVRENPTSVHSVRLTAAIGATATRATAVEERVEVRLDWPELIRPPCAVMDARWQWDRSATRVKRMVFERAHGGPLSGLLEKGELAEAQTLFMAGRELIDEEEIAVIRARREEAMAGWESWALGRNVPKAELQKMIDKVDDDHSGEIEFDEFVVLMRDELQELPARARLVSL